MHTASNVESVLGRIRPALRADGGDIQLVELVGWVARVRLTGACAGCASSHTTLELGIEAALRRMNPRFRVELVP